MEQRLVERIIDIIRTYKREIRSALADEALAAKPLISLGAEMQVWLPQLQEHGVACVNSVKADLAPVFNRNYSGEEEMLFEIRSAFETTAQPMRKLIALHADIACFRSGDEQQQAVLDTTASAVKKILTDLRLFLDDLEEALLENPTGGAVTFEPDLSTELRYIQAWSEAQKSDGTSELVVMLAVAFGLGYMFGGE